MGGGAGVSQVGRGGDGSADTSLLKHPGAKSHQL